MGPKEAFASLRQQFALFRYHANLYQPPIFFTDITIEHSPYFPSRTSMWEQLALIQSTFIEGLPQKALTRIPASPVKIYQHDGC
jgi:hypothetical protein